MTCPATTRQPRVAGLHMHAKEKPAKCDSKPVQLLRSSRPGKLVCMNSNAEVSPRRSGCDEAAAEDRVCSHGRFLHWHHGASAFVGLLGIATCFPSLRLMSGNHAGVSAPHPDSGQGCALSQVAAVFQQPGSRTWVELQSMPAFSCSLHRLKC